MLTLKISRRLTATVDTIEEASELYEKTRNDSEEGASTFPFGLIYEGKKEVGVISYNGRVWDKHPGKHNDAVLLYDNRVFSYPTLKP